LKQQTNPAAGFFEVSFFGDGFTEKLDLTGNRLDQPHDEVKEGGFAAAVGGYQTDALATEEIEIQLIEYHLPAGVIELDAPQFDDWRL
jgi:hypothetical protein